MFTATEMESGPSYCRKTLVVFSLKGTFASGHMKDLAFSYSFYRIPRVTLQDTLLCHVRKACLYILPDPEGQRCRPRLEIM